MKVRAQFILAFFAFAGFLSGLEGIQRVRYPYVGFRNMTNSLGFRSPEFNPQKAPGTFRILFIGGSTTYGVNGPVEATFPYLTGQILHQHDVGKKIEVINAAQPGTNSYWVPQRLEETLNLDPDLVIVMIGENDCASVHQRFVDITRWGDLKITSWQRRLSMWFAHRSVLYVTLREKISIWIHGRPDFAFDDPPDPQKERIATEPGWFKYYPHYFEQNIERSIQLARAHRIRIVFIHPPLSRKRRSQSPIYAEAYDILMGKLHEVASRHDVPLIPSDHFYDDLESSFSAAWDGIHLPLAAIQKMARNISRYLLDHRSQLLW